MALPKHYGSETVPQPDPTGKTVVHTVTLASGETAWMPGTTKHVWFGPGVVTYRVYPDGGVSSEKTTPGAAGTRRANGAKAAK